MRYQKGFVPLFVILLIVLGIGVTGGGYVIYKDKQQQKKFQADLRNSQSNTETTQGQTITTQPTAPTPQKAESPKTVTTTWETYKNQEFGFEIKYPSDLRVDPKVSTDLMLLGMKSNLVKDFVFSLIINRHPSSELTSETLKQTCDKYRQAEENEGKLLECKNVTINGVEYIRVVQELKLSGGRGVTISGQSRSMFLIAAIIIPPAQIGEFSNILEGVLSTIKF
ncbi:MAG: hypothetical protein CO184_01255 [Candidatus Zambryskibacteria bacterium CG_4_9_14_3_um_filter_40_16]|uniref:PsbP C-terminal domain-containing protein n=2 Tax=Candidatus Zambryskiibacteriota TaxID=1817925 RepID=A0A2H0K9A9_9BACT|nr:MAG: hypothetical protein COV95_01345 [Candidatus Zambryskibacteria bacterium CG11_big_fil_rev_8_21_14_0_20_40_24]PJA33701.1 MAG: hypothetical protein CO184_01255 [Candidatus Zambryskibacteria bacterium CG_4_9_14_3_um_filter_40_16]